MEKKYQHIIPGGYLKSWRAPDPPPGHTGQIWVIHKDRPQERALRSPKNCFGLDDHYTILRSGVRDLGVEDALGKVESAFGNVMMRIQQRHPLRAKDKVYLSFFFAAMLARVETFTRPVFNLHRDSYLQAKAIEEKEGLGREGSDAQKEELDNCVGRAVSQAVPRYQRTVERMNLTIFVADDDAGFVTSDSPAFVCVPGRPRAVLLSALLHRGAEATLPLSPHHLAIYTWPQPGMEPRYEVGTRRLVDEANARTLSGCLKEFVSWRGIVRQEWLPPPAA